MSTSILPMLQTQLIRYGMPTVFIFGIIGNCFVIIVFSRRRKNSCAMYLSGAAMLNNLSLAFIIPLSVYTIDHKDPMSNSLVLCKSRFYLTHAWGQLARYLMTFACIDRFVLTTNNARFRIIHRPVIARWIIGIVFISYHIFLLHLLILTTINNGRCGQFGVYYILYQIHILIFVCLIPPVSMTVFSFLAYRNMKQLHKRIRPLSIVITGSQQNITIHRRDRDLFIIVLAEVALYAVTMSSYPFIQSEIAITTYIGISKSIQHIQIESFLNTIASLLTYVNSAVAFYLYLAVSKPFQKDIKDLFTELRHRVLRRVV